MQSASMWTTKRKHTEETVLSVFRSKPYLPESVGAGTKLRGSREECAAVESANASVYVQKVTAGSRSGSQQPTTKRDSHTCHR